MYPDTSFPCPECPSSVDVDVDDMRPTRPPRRLSLRETKKSSTAVHAPDPGPPPPLPQTPTRLQVSVPIPTKKERNRPTKPQHSRKNQVYGDHTSLIPLPTAHHPSSHTDAQCGERPKMVCDNAMPSLAASTNKVTDLPQQRRDKARHTSCPEPILTLPTTPGPGTICTYTG